jgi:hypothetical protein
MLHSSLVALSPPTACTSLTVEDGAAGTTSSEVRITDVNDEGAIAEAFAAMRDELVMFQSIGVYALLAQPTLKGVQLLNTTKAHLPHKHYTSCLGDAAAFLRLLHPDSLPPELLADDGRVFEDTFGSNIVGVQFTPLTSTPWP